MMTNLNNEDGLARNSGRNCRVPGFSYDEHQPLADEASEFV
jgi:hypothetical protein